MKNIIATMIVCSITMLSNAECYRLKTSVTVDVLNEAKECVGKKSLKAGTIVMLDDENLEDDVISSRLKPSGMTVQAFKADKPTKGAVFKALIRRKSWTWLPSCYEGKEKAIRCYSIGIKNKAFDYAGSFHGYVYKTTAIGKKLERKVKDGESLDCYIKIRPLKNSDSQSDVVIDDIEFL